MSDQFIATTFDPFFLGLAVINYKIKTKTNLSDKQKKWMDALKHIIPVFNRLIEHDRLTIDEVASGKKNEPNLDSYAFVNDEKKPSIVKVEEPVPVQVPDEVGDKMVNDLMEKCLRKLLIIQQNKWVSVKEPEEDSDSDSDDEKEAKEVAKEKEIKEAKEAKEKEIKQQEPTTTPPPAYSPDYQPVSYSDASLFQDPIEDYDHARYNKFLEEQLW